MSSDFNKIVGNGVYYISGIGFACGIRLILSDRNTLGDNTVTTIQATVAYGIYLDADSNVNTVVGNTIYNCTTDPLLVSETITNQVAHNVEG